MSPFGLREWEEEASSARQNLWQQRRKKYSTENMIKVENELCLCFVPIQFDTTEV